VKKNKTIGQEKIKRIQTSEDKNKTIGQEKIKTKDSDKRGKTSQKKAPDKRERPRCQELYG